MVWTAAAACEETGRRALQLFALLSAEALREQQLGMGTGGEADFTQRLRHVRHLKPRETGVCHRISSPRQAHAHRLPRPHGPPCRLPQTLTPHAPRAPQVLGELEQYEAACANVRTAVDGTSAVEHVAQRCRLCASMPSELQEARPHQTKTKTGL